MLSQCRDGPCNAYKTYASGCTWVKTAGCVLRRACWPQLIYVECMSILTTVHVWKVWSYRPQLNHLQSTNLLTTVHMQGKCERIDNKSYIRENVCKMKLKRFQLLLMRLTTATVAMPVGKISIFKHANLIVIRNKRLSLWWRECNSVRD